MSALVTNIAHDDYIGRLGIGRLFGGRIEPGDKVVVFSAGGKQAPGQIQKLFVFEGLERKEADAVEAGEIFAFAGIPAVTIGDSIGDPERPVRLDILFIEPPTVSMMFMVNTSPFGGREGKYVTSTKLRERVQKELRTNVSIAVEWNDSPDRFTVAGRGELQIAVLIEQMRREGYEFQVSMPQVITRRDGDRAPRALRDPGSGCAEGECRHRHLHAGRAPGPDGEDDRPQGDVRPADLHRPPARACSASVRNS